MAVELLRLVPSDNSTQLTPGPPSFINRHCHPSFNLLRHHFPPAENMSKHHPDLILCRKLPGIAIGRLCEKDDGKCPICDSYVRPATLVRICEECNFGSSGGKCIICGGQGVSDAYYCAECTRLEKDRDGCPKVVNIGTSRTDLAYLRKARNQQQQ